MKMLSLVCGFVLVGVIVSVLVSKVPSLIKKRKAEAWGSDVDVAGDDVGWVQLHNASCYDEVPLQLAVGDWGGSKSSDPPRQRTHQRQRTDSSHHAVPLIPVLDIDLIDFEGTSNFPNITETVVGNAPLPAYNGKGEEEAGALLDVLERELLEGFKPIHAPVTSAPLGQHHASRKYVSCGLHEDIARSLPGNAQLAPSILLPGSTLSEMYQAHPLDGSHHTNIPTSSSDHISNSSSSSSDHCSNSSSNSRNNSPMQMNMCTNRADANQLVQLPGELGLTFANLHSQMPVPMQVYGRRSLPQHRHNHMAAAGEALRHEFARPSDQSASVGYNPFINGGRGAVDNASASANRKPTPTPPKYKPIPPAAEEGEHAEWRNGEVPLMDPSCKWHPWVLELSAKKRKELFKIYNIADHTMDANGFTIKYSSRRLKQNRAQHVYLMKGGKNRRSEPSDPPPISTHASPTPL
jgi:hypothetical protein